MKSLTCDLVEIFVVVAADEKSIPFRKANRISYSCTNLGIQG